MEEVGFFLLVFCGVIYAIYHFTGWFGFIAIAAAFIGYRLYRADQANRARLEKERAQEEARLAREAAEKERKRKEAEAEQKRLGLELVKCRCSAAIAYAEIPGRLLKVEASLDEAEAAFEEGAFSPYWEAIERALCGLGDIDQTARQIISLADEHRRTAVSFKGTVDAFPIAATDGERIEQLAGETRARLAVVVRRSQTNFQFSTIYEQRKTNQILIQGFTTLADAIYGLGDQLVASLSSMSAQIRRLEEGHERRHHETLDAFDSLAASLVAATEEASEIAAKQRAGIAGEQAEAAERQLAMLDNIQRKRRH